MLALKSVARKGSGCVDGGKGIGASGFCDPCVCLGIFLLLYWRVLMSGIAGGWGYV
jgi:hypothetical protein